VALDFEKNDVGEIIDGELVLNKNHSLWIDNKTYLKNECKECSLFTLCGGRVCPLEKVKNINIKCIDFKDIKEKVVSELVKFREKRR
jgi:radical SAM protein with 4Fe4S-binding SPASM domain